MDNQATESTGELTPESAVDAFSALLSGADEPRKEPQSEPEAELPAIDEPAQDEPVSDEPQEAEMVEVDIDGYKVSLPKEKAAKLEAERLMQADYTKKTMAAAEERKAAQAEAQKAIQERAAYAQNLQKMQAQIEGALHEQQRIDWNALLESDPVEYLRQQHLFQQRQAAYQQNAAEQEKLKALSEADRGKALHNHLTQQREELLAKLPEWKDQAKAQAETESIAKYLITMGFEKDSVVGDGTPEKPGITDHKAILLARKAMLYDQMLEKAKAAAKKVSTLPQKVERPGTGQQSLDKRSTAFQKLSKSGRIDDAAAVFRQFI